jgi:hypothetical protein
MICSGERVWRAGSAGKRARPHILDKVVIDGRSAKLITTLQNRRFRRNYAEIRVQVGAVLQNTPQEKASPHVSPYNHPRGLL